MDKNNPKTEKPLIIGVEPRTAKQIQKELRLTDNEDIKCGIGSCTPDVVQGLARKEIYLALYSIVGVIMGMFFTYMVAVISTIEKRFNLNSKQIGIMLAGNDVSQVLLSIIVSYYGNYGNRPHWMGMGVVSAAISCFVAATPHLIYGAGEDAEYTASTNIFASVWVNTTEGLHLCPNVEANVCAADQNDSGQTYSMPVIIFFISQFILGLSISSYHSIGIVYLDDNLDKKEMPIYYGLSMMVRVMGPVMGFLLGSSCLKLWIDPSESPDISMRDPRWLGAWWLGFLLLGTLLSTAGALLFCFPRQMPSSLASQVEKLEKAALKKSATKELMDVEHYVQITTEKKKDDKPSLKKLPFALKRLVTNKIWLGNSFNTTLFLLALSGYWSFKPKYLETQFHKSASEANMYTGLASLIASIFGLMGGGIWMHWKKPRARVVTAYNVFTTAVGAAVMFSLIFVGCPQIDVQGLDAPCSSSCDCSQEYVPVCAETGVTFYSACLAGCTGANKNGSETTYTNCSCVAPTGPLVNPQQTVSTLGGVATAGYCPQDCNSLFTYISLNTITSMIGSSGRVGGTLVYLRSVEEKDKALALGTLTVLISLFAFIPGPIIMGSIVDSACLIWDYDCDKKGNCWLYDADRFRIGMHLFIAVLMAISILGDLVVWRYSKDLKLYDDKDEEEQVVEMTAASTPSKSEMNRLAITT